MKRYDILDGFRGYFLMFMLINHLGFQGGSLLSHVNHAELGYVQDAQGFIFISGLIVGLYYARGYLDSRSREMDRKILARAATLYRYSLFLLALIVTVAVLFPITELAWGANITNFYTAPLATIPATILLLYQPTYLDILPQYIFYLLASPLLIRWILRGYATAVATGSMLLWLAVQFGWHLPLVMGLETVGQRVHPDFALRSYFNPMAWQILFIGGLLIGCGLRTGRLEVEDWFGPHRAGLARLALGLVLVFMAYRLSITFDVLPSEMKERFEPFSNREEFRLALLLNFVSLGYAVTWVLVSGAKARSMIVRGLQRLLHALFHNRFLRFLGQHSLQVYAYHVVLAYALVLWDQRFGPIHELTKAAITIAGIASLALPAWLHANHSGLWQRWKLSSTSAT